MEKLTEEEIKQGLDKAYKKAGSNAYFANGFKAGISFCCELLVGCCVLIIVYWWIQFSPAVF